MGYNGFENADDDLLDKVHYQMNGNSNSKLTTKMKSEENFAFHPSIINGNKEKIQLVKPEFVEDFVEQYYVRTAYKGKIEIGVTPSEINMA